MESNRTAKMDELVQGAFGRKAVNSSDLDEEVIQKQHEEVQDLMDEDENRLRDRHTVSTVVNQGVIRDVTNTIRVIIGQGMGNQSLVREFLSKLDQAMAEFRESAEFLAEYGDRVKEEYGGSLLELVKEMRGDSEGGGGQYL